MIQRILVGAVVLLLSLAGCTVSPTEAPTVAVTETATVSPQAAPLAVTQEVEPVPVVPPTPEPVPVEPTPVTPPAPPAALGGYELIAALQDQYGVYAHPATRFVVGPCPGDGAHACVKQDIYTETGVAVGQNITLYIQPDQITPYLLFHEIAHTHGIMDECGADQFARSVVGPVAGYYC